MSSSFFNNPKFEAWLNKEVDKISSKIDKEELSNREIVILMLKEQGDYFHKMEKRRIEKLKANN